MNASIHRGVPRSRGRLARNAGRVTLWAGVALIFWRGVGEIVSPRPAAVRPALTSATPSWPDGEARAFAVAYARALLAPGGSRSERQAVLARFSSQSLSDQAVPQAPSRSPGAAVADATVAREVPLGDSRAILTVAIFTEAGRRRYLAVPVARDERGGLAVYDLPWYVSPPPLGVAEPPAVTPLSGPSQHAVEELARRFLIAYIHDDRGTLAYLVAPGAYVAPIGAGMWVEQIEEIGRLSGSPARGMLLAVTARVRDRMTKTAHRQRFRIKVAHADRWLVTAVIGGPQR